MTTSLNESVEDFKERFHRYFQHEVTALHEQMEQLPNMSTVHGVRNDAVDHCLAGIARLSQEVGDANKHLPAYDQRTYSAAVKALSEKLTTIRNQFAPRPKFTFKAALKTREKHAQPIAPASIVSSAPQASSSTSINEQQQQQLQQQQKVTTTTTTITDIDPSADRANNLIRSSSSRTKSRTIHTPDFESARSIALVDQHDVYIKCSPAAIRGRDGRAARILDISRCIIDLRGSSSSSSDGGGGGGDTTSSTTTQQQALAAMTIRNVQESVLLVSGRVDGAVHVTNVKGSVIVANCRQLRMHECQDVRVYLYCSSRPIIEASSGIGFAPLPLVLRGQDERQQRDGIEREEQEEEDGNQWSHVDDFNWLQQEASPNWYRIAENERITDDVWDQVIEPREAQGLVSSTLTAFGVSTS